MTPTTPIPREEIEASLLDRGNRVLGSSSVAVVGIVLAGSYRRSDSAFNGLLPRPLVPVAQAPLVSYALRWLAASGVTAAKLCINDHSRPLDSWLTTAQSRFGIPLDFVEDPSPRGPAGSARDAALTTPADTFIVVEGTVIPVLNVDAVVTEHVRRGAALTVVVQDHVIGRAGGAQVTTPAGIYIFSRRAFESVSSTGFQDIKEHLIPALRRRGERVAGYVAPAYSPRVLDAETYLAVNHWVIERMIGENDPIGSSEVFCCRNGDLVAHPTVDVHQTARLIGPVVVGAGASIGAHATVVGPASIGPRTTIGERAVVCRSVLWTNCEIGADAFVDHGVVADDVRIPPRSTVHREVKMRVAPRWHLGAAPHVKAQRIQRAPAGSIADPAVP